MLKYIVVFLILCSVSYAETLDQKVASLNALTNTVLKAWIERPSEPLGETGLNTATVAWYSIEGNTVRRGGSDVIISGENSYWVGGTPSPLAVVAEVKFLSSRTTGGWGNLTRSQQLDAIKSFCNAVYKTANEGASDIREFECDPIDGSTIRVTGFFDAGTEWHRQSWYVRLIDANGSVSAPYTNVEFQKCVD